MCVISAKRKLETGEITAVKAEHSANQDNKPENAVENARDLDLATRSTAGLDSNGKLWVKLTLDEIHCVEKIVSYRPSGSPYQTWTCPSTACTCEGADCSSFSMTVSSAKSSPQNLPNVPDCVYGDTAMFERPGGTFISLVEISITGKGEILETCT